MYNEIIKNAYMETLNEVNKKQMQTIFKQSEPYELKYDCDIALFNYQELHEFFISLNCQYSSKIRYYKTRLLQYFQWYSMIENNNLDVIERISDKEIFKHSKSVLFKDEDEMINYTQMILAKYSTVTKWVMVAIIYLLWNGIIEEDIVHIKKTDIDIENKCINVQGNQIKMNEYIIEYLNNFANTSIIESTKGNYCYSYSPYLIRFANRTEIKNNEPISKTKIPKIIKSGNTRTVNNSIITVKNILMNGEFYRLKQQGVNIETENIKNNKILHHIKINPINLKEQYEKFLEL